MVAIVEGGPRRRRPAAVRDVRWVRLDGLHLTLRFIGLVRRGRDRGASARRWIGPPPTIAPFEVAIEGAGRSRRSARPRVLWLDVTDGRSALTAAAAAASTTSSAVAGLERSDRPYRAHLTTSARAGGSGPGGRRAAARRGRRPATDARSRATELVPFETIGGGGPARYEPLRQAELCAPDAVRNETAQAGAR